MQNTRDGEERKGKIVRRAMSTIARSYLCSMFSFSCSLSLSLSFAALLGGEEEATTCYSTSAWVTFVPMCVCVQKEEGE